MITDVCNAFTVLRSSVCAALLHVGAGGTNSGTRRTLALAGLALLALPFAGLSAATGPRPPWIHGQAPVRVVQAHGSHDFSVIRMPAETPDGGAIQAFEVRCGQRVLPHRVVGVPYMEDMAILVDALSAETDAALICYGFTNRPPDAGQAVLRDPQPVSASLFRVKSQDSPTSADAIRFMGRNLTRPYRSFRLSSMRRIQLVRSDGRHSHRASRRYRVLARLSSLLVVPKEGLYRFGLAGARAAYLRVDGSIVAECMDGSRKAARRVGEAIELTAGVHVVEVEAIGRYQLALRLLWQPEGTAEPTEIPAEALLSAPPGRGLRRVEWRDRVVHPAMTMVPGAAYGFFGRPTTFVPVTLGNGSVDWTGTRPKVSWWQGERRLGEGLRLRAVVEAATSDPIELRLRTGLGFEESIQTAAPDVGAWAREYRIAGVLKGVPAAGYGTDRVQPELWVQGTCPESVPLDVTVREFDADGAMRSSSSTVVLREGWGSVGLAERSLERLERLEWSIAHAGVELLSGALHSVRPPFRRLPDRICGGALFEGATQLVLVPRRVSQSEEFGSRRPRRVPVPSEVVCLDSCLWSPGAGETTGENYVSILADRLRSVGVDPTQVVYRDAETIDEGVGEVPVRGLLPLVQPLGTHDAADLVVLSLGREAWLRRETPGDFERRAGALTALLTEALGVRVVWVTPPPYGSRERMRPYAEAILRVADAYDTEVADLYTAVLGHESPERLVKGMALTPEGQAVAGRVIGRQVTNREGVMR